ALSGVKVKPNPSGVFRAEESLNVWQEFYGLTVDFSRSVYPKFELLISQNSQVIEKRIVGGSFGQYSGSPSQGTYTDSVPLSQFAPGAYEVQLKVTDGVTKQSLVTRKAFT